MKINNRAFCIAIASSILTAHFEKQVFLKMQNRCVNFSNPSTSEVFALWAIEFSDYFSSKFKRWDYQLEQGVQLLSWQMTEINCFEELVKDFGYHKFNHF